MWPERVVEAAPALDDDACLGQRVEDLAVKQFIAQAGIEAFDVAIFPGRAWLDVGRPGADRCNPVLDRLGDELRSIIGPDVLRHAAQDEQV